MNDFANYVISDAWPLGKLGNLPPEIRALSWRLLILSTYLAESQQNDGHVFNSKPLSALIQVSGTHHDIRYLFPEDLDGRQFNLSFGQSTVRFETVRSRIISPYTVHDAFGSITRILDTLPSHAIAVFARTIPHAHSLKLTSEFDLATYARYGL